MARKCVYCGQEGNLTLEHVINKSLLEKIYPNDMRYFVHNKDRDTRLQNHEPTVKDVCADCNNVKLSPYDIASLGFTDAILSFDPNKRIVLPFNQDSLGWLLKTHLNISRATGAQKSLRYTVDQGLYNSLYNHTLVPLDKFALKVAFHIQLQKSEYGEGTTTDMHHFIQLNVPNIIFSYFRIKHFESILIFPKLATDDFEHNLGTYQKQFEDVNAGKKFLLLPVKDFLDRGEIVVSGT